MRELAAFVRQTGRALEYQLPDGRWISIGDDELDDVLERYRLSSNVAIAAGFEGHGRFAGEEKVRHRPGRKPDKPTPEQDCVIEIITDEARKAQVNVKEYAGELLHPDGGLRDQKKTESRLGFSHQTIEKALARIISAGNRQ